MKYFKMNLMVRMMTTVTRIVVNEGSCIWVGKAMICWNLFVGYFRNLKNNNSELSKSRYFNFPNFFVEKAGSLGMLVLN